MPRSWAYQLIACRVIRRGRRVSEDLHYDLLSDFEPKGEVARLFGAYRQSDGISERAIFIVDKEGKIAFKDIHDISDQPDNEELV